MKYLSLFLFAFVFSIGCSPNQHFESVTWQKGNPTSDSVKKSVKKILKQEAKGHTLSKATVTSDSYQLHRWRQKLANTPLKNTWVQTIRKDGELRSLKSVYMQELNRKAKSSLINLANKKESILAELKKSDEALRTAAEVFPMELELLPHGDNGIAVLSVRFLIQDESDVVEYRVNEKAKIVSTRSVAHNAVDAIATVFTSAPTYSALIDVVFKGLIGNGTLTSHKLKVYSEFNPNPNYSHVFKFEVNEPEFNDVQAYYFARNAIEWFQTKLNVTLPFQLNVKTHVGGKTPKNVAFYYQGKVRLGDGDGRTYKNIPRDPTMVTHEVCHGLIDTLAGLPFEGEGGSLNEGFTDFCAANMLNNPRMGEYAYLKGPYRRSLENNLQAFKDFNGGLYHDSTVVSGTFWDIRKALGAEIAADLMAKTLFRLGPNGKFKDLPIAVTDALSDGYVETDKAAVQDVLATRGW